MNRYTPIAYGRGIINCKESYTQKQIQEMFLKLGDLEDIEEELGIDLIAFLTECKYVLDNCSMSAGKMTNGNEIKTDYGYVYEFIDGIKEGLKNDRN